MVSDATLARSRKVSVAFRFISERSENNCKIFKDREKSMANPSLNTTFNCDVCHLRITDDVGAKSPAKTN